MSVLELACGALLIAGAPLSALAATPVLALFVTRSACPEGAVEHGALIVDEFAPAKGQGLPSSRAGDDPGCAPPS